MSTARETCWFALLGLAACAAATPREPSVEATAAAEQAPPRVTIEDLARRILREKAREHRDWSDRVTFELWRVEQVDDELVCYVRVDNVSQQPLTVCASEPGRFAEFGIDLVADEPPGRAGCAMGLGAWSLRQLAPGDTMLIVARRLGDDVAFAASFAVFPEDGVAFCSSRRFEAADLRDKLRDRQLTGGGR